MNPNEIDGLFRALPIEITYADLNDRVRFYTESDLMKKGFVRTKTILGRRLAYCHSPRLENYVMLNVNALKRGEFNYREFWTRLGDRIIRVIIAPVKDRNNSLLGVVEIVEDLTEVVENPAEIKKRIMVL
uniref:Histidine kinase n=1 Tax=Staphylothermus marinus TaxID=2280 RepID=A0A7J3KFX8_STAMA